MTMMTNQKLRYFKDIIYKIKWLAGLILVGIIASGCTISMQPVQSPRYFNYIEPSPYHWYYNPYYYSPSIHIHPKPQLHYPRHNGPRR